MPESPDGSGLPADPVAPADGSEEPLPEAPVRAIVEALLFASEEPVMLEEVISLIGEDRRDEAAAALAALEGEYAGAERGLLVQRLAGGYRITTDPRMAPFVREMVRGRNRRRLSRPALETLALIAYKQPITGPEIQEIRGVSPSGILSTLLDHRLIRILGRKKVVGKPFLYGTTQDFLIRFGLNTLEDLPAVEEFDALIAAENPAEDPPLASAGTADGGEAAAGEGES